MSVFTTVTDEQLRDWLRAYPLGELLGLQGIASGITNTNYFVTTTTGRYVLTLFEKNSAEELPYFLDLMTHLASRGIPCPRPVIDHHGRSLGSLNGKPAALVSCLRGKDIETPSLLQCRQLGRVMAEMHKSGLSFAAKMQNPRGAEWCMATARQVMGFLSAEDRELLQQALQFQSGFRPQALPQGVIHADLFRDNVLFDGEELGGLIDFYYACNDAMLYDLAIAANDWCSAADGSMNEAGLAAMVQGYDAVRLISKAEQLAWPGLLRTAALRFWLSRLYDLHFPQAGELTHAKDPVYFRDILRMHGKGVLPLSDLCQGVH